MFAAFNFRWPPLALGMLSIMSAAAFNLQTLAPECIMEWTVFQKWLLVQSLPLIVFVACAGTALLVGAVKRFATWRQRRENRWGIAVQHLSTNSPASIFDTLYGIFFAGL
jgi:hypothetical protein